MTFPSFLSEERLNNLLSSFSAGLLLRLSSRAACSGSYFSPGGSTSDLSRMRRPNFGIPMVVGVILRLGQSRMRGQSSSGSLNHREDVMSNSLPAFQTR